MPAELIAKYIDGKRIDLGLTYDALATSSNSAESTVKSLCRAKVDNPGINTVIPVMEAVGGSWDEMLHPEKSKKEIKDAAVLAQKDLYEYQIATMKETSEVHITNIRAHYELNVTELKENHKKIEEHYEKRLADKREVITELEKHLATVNAHLITAEKEKKWFQLGFVASIIAFAALCIAELANPTIGWIRW